jgi:hypothetical protein
MEEEGQFHYKAFNPNFNARFPKWGRLPKILMVMLKA